MTEQQAEPLAQVQCDRCGQTDDHPMVHVSGVWRKDDRITITAPSFHFDCLPQEFVDLMGDAPQHTVTQFAIIAAREGTHGDELRALIQEQPTDNNVTPEG
jgi:hypothetical protein